MFAMQLGQAIGKLSGQVLSGADIGLPIFTEQRAAFVPQNVDEFVLGLDIDAREAQIYLAVRELAHARLFKHSKWLRDHVVSQITNYAADINIDDSKIQDAVSNNDLSDPSRMKEMLESGALLGDKTEDQKRSLESIETMLALIEGWVDAVAEDATKLLPKQAAIAETVRRRRATGGPAELAFGTLVGLELRPRKLREATEMWRQVGAALGTEKRDSLWDHPDMLPSAADIEYPGLLITRLQTGGDDMDAALRDLLGN
jgi:putative hydrolase